MLDYLLTCLIISVCALLALKGLKNAPARLSFYFLVFALLSWLVPWQSISKAPLLEMPPLFILDVSKLSFDPEQKIIATQAVTANKATLLEQKHSFITWSFANVFIVLCSIGFVLLLWRICAYVSLVRNLYSNSMPVNQLQDVSKGYPIRVTNLSEPAIATGLLTPMIWLDKKMQGREELESVIYHEATHLKQGDIYWTWLICVTECIFWWNPICTKLAQLARQQLELSCDEQCMKKLQGKYQLDLASLLLSLKNHKKNGHLFTPPLLNISHSTNFNVQRIKMLNKEKTMKSKYLLLVTAAMSLSAMAATQIVDGKNSTAQDKSVQQQVAKSEQYNQQLATLLSRVTGAKSKQPAELNEAANNILDWYQNRSPLSANEELEIKILSFTLINHIYHKLGQYQDSLNAYEKWYGQDDSAPYFLKNPLASTYMELGRHELAIQELESLSDILNGNLQPGSRINLARAYIEVSNYDKAISLLSDSSVGENAYANILKYYVYDKQNNHQKAGELKAKIPGAYAVTPAMLPGIGIPGSPLLKQI